MRTLITVLVLFVLAANCQQNEITLEKLTDRAIAGSPFTLSCTLDPYLNTSNVIWIKDGTAVLTSSFSGKTTEIDVNRTQIHNVKGRYFFNVLGHYEHHLVLWVNPRLDEGSVWMCMPSNSNLHSEPFIIHTFEPEEPSQCGWWCIVGSTVGVVLALLCLDLLFCTRCFTKRI